MSREKFFSIDTFCDYESYEKFLERIFSFQRSDFKFGFDKLYPSASVKSKVNENGEFNRFVGDTVVFNLDDAQKRFIKDYYISPLHRVGSDYFAEKLDESMLHMTLHDLNASDREDEKFMADMLETEILLYKIISDIGIKSESIEMETTCVFNMVNTSLVLGMKPKSEEDYHKLMGIYQMVESVLKLPYSFTPHITLAYYNRNGIEGVQLQRLERTINELNREKFDIVLSTDKLYYQKFINMNGYYNIMRMVR